MSVSPISLTFEVPSPLTVSIARIVCSSSITVNFGNGSLVYGAGTQDITRSYTVAGTYTVTITAGTNNSISEFSAVNGGTASPYLTAINSWGSFNITSLASFLQNYTGTLTAIPPLPSTVTTLWTAFRGLTGTIPSITGWNTSNVTNMSEMFVNSTFNQPIGNWDLSSCVLMYYMFAGATSFNQQISGWKFKSSDLNQMLSGATSFNQNLGALDISGVYNLDAFLLNTGMSEANINSTLQGWAAQSVQSNVTFSASGYYSGLGYTAATQLRSSKNWTINGLSVRPISLTFVIPTTSQQIIFYLGLNASVTIDWGDATATTTTSTSQNNSHTYSAAGTYNVTVTGATPTSVFRFGIESNLKMSSYLTAINSWGGFTLTHLNSMLYGFGGTLTTIPDLPSTVTSLNYAFSDMSGTIPNITGWNTANVTSMVGTFSGTYAKFNQNISGWDVSNLTGAYATFAENVYFNQPIGSWNVAKLTSAAYMFRGTYFNQPLTNWNVAKNCNFTGMFQSSKAFNQSINHLDISGANMNSMFQNAIAFNQNLGSVNISGVTSFFGFLSGSAMSEANVNLTLQGWSQQTVKPNVTLDMDGLYYSGDGYAAATILRASPKSWTINGLLLPPIRLKYVIPTSGVTVRIGLKLNASVTIDWGDTTNTTTSLTQNHSKTYSAANTYNVTITGSLPTSIYGFGMQSSVATSPYLTEISSWGGFNLTDLTNMLYGFTGTLTTLPPLPSTVTNLQWAFFLTTGTFPDITTWYTNNVTNMFGMFHGANFNQAIGNWNVSKVTTVYGMFTDSTTFNQPLSSWRLPANCNLQNMFIRASAFNQNMGAFDISGATNLSGFLTGSAMSEENMNLTLQGWAEQTVQSNVTLDANGYYSGLGYAAAAQLRSSKNWTINGLLLLPPMQFTFTFPSSATYQLFKILSTSEIIVNFGNGTTTLAAGDNDISRAYTAGTYTVTIVSASANAIYGFSAYGYGTASPYLTAINSWGSYNLTNMTAMLKDYSGTLTTIPLLPSTVTVLTSAFYQLSGTIPSITSWDTSNVTTMTQMFEGSTSFNQEIGGWDVSKVDEAYYMFNRAITFNQPLNNWRFAPNCNLQQMFASTSAFNQSIVGWNVTGSSMVNMFLNATAFNQNLGALDISGITDLTNCLKNCGMSDANVNLTLQGWASQNVKSNVTLDMDNLYYGSVGYTAATQLRSSKNWTINGVAVRPIILQFVIPASNTLTYSTIMQPVGNTATINWGDSQSTTANDGNANGTTYSHTYASAGTYTVTIAGSTPNSVTGLGNRDGSYQPSRYIKQVVSWGGFNLSTLYKTFAACSSITSIPQLPSTITNLDYAFSDYTDSSASPLDISYWDVSGVTNMIGIFAVSTFNPDVTNWNTKSLRELRDAFYQAFTFNRNLSNWNISSLTNGTGMNNYTFYSAGFSTENFSNTLYGWSLQSVKPTGFTLFLDPVSNAAKLSYYGRVGYNTLTTSPNNWVIDGTVDSPMKLTFATPTSNCSTAVYLGINSSVTIAWGDGSSNTITVSGSVTHVYSASGTYSATITGATANAIFQFGDPSLVTKSPYLKSIDTWGIYNLTSIAGAFNGINGTLTFAGKPPLTVTSMQNLFYDASNLTLDLNAWTPSAVTNMSGLLQNSKNCNPLISSWTTQSVTNLQNAFLNATGFNQNLGSWNVGNVTNMTGLFSYSGISTANFGSTLLGWSSQTVQPNVALQAYGKTFDSNGQTGYNILTVSPKNWGIFTFEPIQLTIVTPVSNSSTTIYLGVSGSVSISWGDGSSNTFSTSQAVSHLYSASGTYSATIVGQTTNSITQFGDSTLATSATFLTQITSWGPYNITSLAGAFNGINGTLTSVAAIPATVTNLASLFSGASNLSLNLGAWDVSGVTNMSGLLKNTTNCNPTISAWNTKSVTTLQDAFLNATGFNQNLGSWNVGNVTNMLGLFSYSGISTANFGSTLLGWSSQTVQPNLTLEAYGETLDASGQNGYNVLTASPKNWTIKTVAPIQLTITTPSSNQTTSIYLGVNVEVTINWGDGSSNVLSSTGSVSHQYSSASAYSVSISGIQASDIYQFGDSTLATSVAYLTQVNSWGGFTLTSLAGAFNGINGSILTSVATIPSTVTNLSSLFSGASNVSLNLGTWDVSGVTNMSGLLQNSTGSNPTISAWNTKSVTTLQNAFSNAAAFNQSLSSWNVTNVSNMRGVLSYSGISTANFGTTLLGWSSQAVRSNIIMDAYGETLDSNGQTGFNTLTSSPKNWSIFVRGPMELTITTPSTNLYTVIYLGVSGAVNINWGDNSLSAISTSGTISHQYAAEGTYTVFISGNDATSITQFGDSSLTTSVSYLTRVDSWGEFNITSLSGAFNSINGTLTSVAAIPATVTNLASLFSGASNISPNLSAWDVSGVTNMSSLLKNSTGCNPAISAWNTKSVTTLQNAFLNATGFNQSLASWNVGNVTNMLGAFSYSGVNGTNFSAALYAWSLQTVQSNVVMDASGMYYNQRGIQGYNVLTAPTKSWVINGVTLEPMQLTFTIPRANVSSTMYLGVSGSVTVNWGDGSSNVVSSTDAVSHIYSSAGTYNVTISGSSVNSLYQFGDPTLTYKSIYLTRVDSYGAFNLTSLAGAFSSTSNLSYLPPLPATVTNTSNMFSYASYVTADISAWDVSGVTDMSEMFSCAIGQSGCFNPDIALWNPQNVTNMQKMFYGNNAFNRAIGGWSTSNVTNMSGMFQDASAFNQPLNNWTTTSVTNMSNMFKRASSFNQPLNNWTTTSVTNMSNMFNDASAFNQTLGSWNVSNVTNMTNMLNYTALSSANFSDLLQGWSTQTMQSGVSLGAAGLVYDASGAQALQTLQTNSGWIVSVAAPSAAMTLVYVITSSATVTFNLAVNAGSTATVNWGDRLNRKYTITSSGTTSFFYSRAGTYTVTITGNLAGFGIVPGGAFNALSGADKLTTISSFGSIGLTYCNFVGATNLTSVPNLLPSTITNMYAMFYDCTKLNDANISNWNTANVTNLDYTFRYNTAFNQPLNDWNTANVTSARYTFLNTIVFNQPLNNWQMSKVTTMEGMLNLARVFNQPIENWNTSNVVNMSSLFSEANSFNQSLNNWDVTNVTNMVGTFYGANSFNQPLNNWNTSKVTNMAYMFQHASSFNQPIYTWDVANVSNMAYTFSYATAFNQPLDNWNVANVTSMTGMFYNARNFNQSLNSWNVAKVTSMDWMFESAVAFQGDISAWDVSSVENMNYMFRNMNYNEDITRWNNRSLKYAAAMFQSNTTFNQNISGWNTTSLQDFSYMFYGASAFNQNIGSWSLKKATTLYIMLTSAGLSMDNFSNTLVGWAAQPDASNVSVNAHGLIYNLAGYNAIVTLSSRNFTVANASLQPMTLTLSIPSAGTSAALFLGMSGTVTVDWGDGFSNTSTGSGTASAIQRTYTSAGTYTVTVSSATPTSIYQFGDPSRVYKSTFLSSIVNYGPFNFTSFAGAFNNTNFRLTSVPPLPSTVTDINNIFADASSSLTLDISAWDVSGVTNMRGAFQCTAGQPAGYNPNIVNWNTKNATNTELMFANNKSFNRAIGSWNVAKVTNMSDMFVGASAFNQPINSWNTAAVTLMTRMFSGATSFNQSLNNWSIAGLVSAAAMGNMLDNCAMSTANFNDFLVNLNSYSKTGITLGAAGRVFNGTAAIQSFANLRASKSWTINGATSLSSLSQYSGYQFTFVYYNYSGLPAANKVYTLRDGSDSIATFNAGATVPNTTAYSFTTTLFSGGNHTLSIVDPSGVVVLSSAIVNVSFICFKEDTKILCLKYDREEYVPIQKLKRGDMVKTRLSGYVPIDMIGKTRIYNEGVQERIKDQLYVCKKSKYPEVFEDLYITGAHSILVDKLTETQKRKSLELFDQVCMTEGKYRLMACIDERAAPYEKAGEYNIYHIALANDDPYSNYGVYANGLLVESCSKRFLLDLSNMVILK